MKLNPEAKALPNNRPTFVNSIIFIPLVAILGFGFAYDGGRYWMLILCFVIREAIFLYPLIRSRRIDYFEPVVLSIFFACLADYRIFYLILYEDFSSELWSMSQADAIHYGSLAFLYQAIGAIALYAGYYSSLGTSWGSRWHAPALDSWNVKRLRFLVLIMSIIGLVSYLLITVLTAGSPLNYLNYVETYKRELKGLATLLRTAQFPLIALYIWYGYHLTQEKTRWFWVYLCVCLVMLGSLGQRSYVIYPLLTLLIIRHYVQKPIEIWRGIAFVLFVVLFAVVVMDIRSSKYESRSGELSLQVVRSKEYSPLTVLNDWIRDRRSYDVLVEVIHRVPEEIEFQSGRSYLYYALAPIPRFVWPNKRAFISEHSIDEGTVVGAPYQPPGFLSGLYLNFFLPGIIAGFFFWGILLRALYAWLQRNPKNTWVLILYAVSVVSLTEGPTPLTVSVWLNIFLPLIVSIVYLNGRRVEAQPVHPSPSKESRALLE